MHSTVSDGWRDPDEVAHLAADHGVRVMALTDHDTVYGVGRARAVAHRRGLGYVTALEVTTNPPNQMRHILGHGVDPNHPQLTEVVPGQSFRLETSVIPLKRFAFECQVATGAAGKTTISQAIHVGGPLGGLVGGMMGRQIADTFPALLQGLARKAEASEGRS